MATEYVVLRRMIEQGAEGETWSEVGRASAATPKAAIKAVTDGKPAAERTGTFVGVPARSFQPVTRRVEAAEKEIWG